LSADPVNTNWLLSARDTLTVTFDPTSVYVTWPNDVPAGGHANPVLLALLIWHDVKSNVTAWLTLGNAALAASAATPAKAARDEELFIMTSIFRVYKPAAKSRINSQRKALPKL
jgi:hypothetical protein